MCMGETMYMHAKIRKRMEQPAFDSFMGSAQIECIGSNIIALIKNPLYERK